MGLSNFIRVGTDHIIWQKGLAFYRDELQSMGDQLVKIASRDASVEFYQQIEHFQNQMIVQQNNIDELKHEVNLYIERLGKGTSLVEEQASLHERYQAFERVMNLLRHEFAEFMASGN